MYFSVKNSPAPDGGLHDPTVLWTLVKNHGEPAFRHEIEVSSDSASSFLKIVVQVRCVTGGDVRDPQDREMVESPFPQIQVPETFGPVEVSLDVRSRFVVLESSQGFLELTRGAREIIPFEVSAAGEDVNVRRKVRPVQKRV